MPKYKIVHRWSEINHYRSVIEVEAEDEDSARELASDDESRWDGDFLDSDIVDSELEIEDHTEDCNCSECGLPEPKQRNLPAWW